MKSLWARRMSKAASSHSSAQSGKNVDLDQSGPGNPTTVADGEGELVRTLEALLRGVAAIIVTAGQRTVFGLRRDFELVGPWAVSIGVTQNYVHAGRLGCSNGLGQRNRRDVSTVVVTNDEQSRTL